ncbi:PREDICTED: uncharacterized protein C17orf53 homolog isoform X2 [Chinchilla lanigera]|uniref:uncharacterized protein C17orf53 homolog isoform X2 n=1 Tax=Chinchilla lanigera TaxID=34839 RepID=UPI00038E9A61|nr:PREDICTED: uncharacterized protein C17orf53 homolog isoform X2 [Chinchilla lanigera]
MHQHRPEPAGPRLESGPGAPCGRDSSAPPAVPSEACGPWTLFSVDEDFEDEDFLSAVEDAENQLAGAPPGPAGHLQPVSPSLQAPSPSPPALHPSAALAAQCPPALRLCPAAPDVPRAIRDPPRPHLTSSNWMGSQRTEGTWGALAKDDLDEVLASLELGLGAGARGPAPAKRARVLDLSELTSRPVAALPLQDPPAPTGPQRTPRPLLRPGATWAGATPPGQLPRPLGTSSGGPCHGSPLPPPLACAGSKPRPAGLQAPGACAPATPGTGRAASPRLPPAPRAPAASPVGTPRGPHFSLQTPVVTNHLLQLVTAATRTPAYTRTRRFPGPAGLLPQHGGKNPEEIVVSTPQTPAHGALAKLRVEATVTSSQALAEEDFGRGPWLAMKAALGLDEGDPACFLHTCSVAMVLRKWQSCPTGSPEAAPREQGAHHGRAGQVPDAQHRGRQRGAQRPHGGDAGHGAPGAAGGAAGRAEARRCAAAAAGRGVLPVPPEPLPQRDTQQLGPRLQPGLRGPGPPRPPAARPPGPRKSPGKTPGRCGP